MSLGLQASPTILQSVSDIVKAIPSAALFDAHTVIEALRLEHGVEYVKFCAAYVTLAKAHSELAKILADPSLQLLCKRHRDGNGQPWQAYSKNVNLDLTANSVWERQ